MKRYLGLTIGLTVVLAGIAPAQVRPLPFDLLEKAIKARGDESQLKRFQAFTARGSGECLFMPVTWECAVQFPDRQRLAIKGTEEFEELFGALVVLDGDRGWRQKNGKVESLSADELQSVRSGLYGWWVATLLPLRGSEYSLKLTGEARFTMKGEKPPERERLALGLLAAKPGYPDVHLFFDKGTMELIKVEHSITPHNREPRAELFLSNYRVINGIRLPTRQCTYLGGMPFLDVDIHEWVTQETLAAELFEAPR